MRTAQAKYGKKAMSGEQMRWGFENLDLTKQRLVDLGLGGFTNPVKVSCADHETGGPIAIQQWDGSKWNIVSDWIDPFTDIVRPMIKKSAAMYAKENKIIPRKC
jgi:branched-chain amino acid transport system substrate-binding protein